MDNNFVWADLSTFDLEIAENFYSDIFGWKYSKIPTVTAELTVKLETALHSNAADGGV